MECGRDMNAAMSRMARYRRRVKYSGRGRAGAMARERRLRRWDEMSVVDKCRSNINVYVRNGMRNDTRGGHLRALLMVLLLCRLSVTILSCYIFRHYSL